YSRSGNPTRAVLEQQLAELERGTRAFAFSSGLAALTAVTRLLKPGDEILVVDDVYGGTCRLFSKILKRSEISVRYVHGSTAEDFYLIQNGEGAVLGPFDSYLLLRGIKTLGVRIERQQDNAERIAHFLSSHAAVKRTYYPSLLDKKSLSIHARQAQGNGAVVSFETGSLR